jgi:hypothetical protein
MPYAPFGSIPTPSFSGYYANATEDPYQESFAETESSDDNAEQHDADSNSSTEPDGDQALLAKAHMVAGTCHHCGKEFASRNVLFDHLAGCQKELTPISDALLANVHDLPVIESETNCLPASDRMCRSWRYLTASIGIHSKSHMDKICLDTGCTRTLIDEKTALDLHLEPQDADPIAVSGIGSLHESGKTVSFDAFIPGQIKGRLVLGKLPVTAYLVKDLPTKLLVGMNVMGPEGFEIDLWLRKGKIHACHGLEFPFQIQSKPNRIRTVPVYAAGRFILPPHTRGRIPIRVKRKLPRDRDFIFEPSNRTGYTMYAQLVDADFAWVEVENKTPRTIIIGRRSRLGCVSDADFAIAAEINPEHSYLAASDPATCMLAAQTIDLRAERLATCNTCHLAGSDPSEWRHDQIKFLVEQLLEAQPDQPGWWDEEEPDAPLRIALEKEHHSFIQVFLDGCGPDTLYAILSEKTRHPQGTILHLAISLRSPFTERIMRTCSAEDPIFSAQDHMGWTPLHLAVTAEDAAFAACELGSDSGLPWRLPAFSSYDTVRQLIARHTRALFLEDSDWHTPYRRRLVWLLRRERMPDGSSTQPNTFDKAVDRGLSDALANDPVLSYIRTHLIRRFPPAKASQALYPAGQGKVWRPYRSKVLT